MVYARVAFAGWLLVTELSTISSMMKSGGIGYNIGRFLVFIAVIGICLRILVCGIDCFVISLEKIASLRTSCAEGRFSGTGCKQSKITLYIP
jgi:hypothetical protein